MLRERLKKEGIEIVVGDYVEIDETNNTTKQAVITTLYERITYINRPSLANMDQNIIVMSLSQPNINLNTLDRFLTQSQIFKLNKIICINKCDLNDKYNILPNIRTLYSSLNEKIIEISAKNQIGLEQLKDLLKNKRTVLSGPSGVGKSTIIKALRPDLNIKIGNIGSKSQKGTHTTRHSELIAVNPNEIHSGLIADTAGFTYLKFDKFLPEEIEKQFNEFIPLKKLCLYSNCLHLKEANCGVRDNLSSIYQSRYDNYCKFIEETMEYKEKISSSSIKDEGKVKTINSSGNNKIRKLKLGHNLTDVSRKSYKQKLTSIIANQNDSNNIEGNID